MQRGHRVLPAYLGDELEECRFPDAVCADDVEPVACGCKVERSGPIATDEVVRLEQKKGNMELGWPCVQCRWW